MCKFYQMGHCARGPICNFSHAEDELQPKPDLSKTRLCRKFQRHRCSDSACRFAHGTQELRRRPMNKASVAADPSTTTDDIQDEVVIRVKNTFIHIEVPKVTDKTPRARSAGP